MMPLSNRAINTNPIHPRQWAESACRGKGGFKEAFGIATKCAAEFLGEDKSTPNPSRKYWLEVCEHIKRIAPPGELETK